MIVNAPIVVIRVQGQLIKYYFPLWSPLEWNNGELLDWESGDLTQQRGLGKLTSLWILTCEKKAMVEKAG